MHVFEVEIVSRADGQRLLHHVRAVDETSARAKVQRHHGPLAVLKPGATIRRPCTADEIAEELAKENAT